MQWLSYVGGTGGIGVLLGAMRLLFVYLLKGLVDENKRLTTRNVELEERFLKDHPVNP